MRNAEHLHPYSWDQSPARPRGESRALLKVPRGLLVSQAARYAPTYRLNICQSPPPASNPYVEAPSLSVAVFGDGASKKVIKVK